MRLYEVTIRYEDDDLIEFKGKYWGTSPSAALADAIYTASRKYGKVSSSIDSVSIDTAARTVGS